MIHRERYVRYLASWPDGIDKRALAESSEAINWELERKRPVVEKDRYIPETDHSIPDNVS